MDIQRIKTALLRGKLDNLYLHNNPRVEVAESLRDRTRWMTCWCRARAASCAPSSRAALNWQVVPDISGSIYPALEYGTAREMRTGVTRQGQGIDANALQNQSGNRTVNQVFTMAQARMN